MAVLVPPRAATTPRSSLTASYSGMIFCPPSTSANRRGYAQGADVKPQIRGGRELHPGPRRTACNPRDRCFVGMLRTRMPWSETWSPARSTLDSRVIPNNPPGEKCHSPYKSRECVECEGREAARFECWSVEILRPFRSTEEPRKGRSALKSPARARIRIRQYLHRHIAALGPLARMVRTLYALSNGLCISRDFHVGACSESREMRPSRADMERSGPGFLPRTQPPHEEDAFRLPSRVVFRGVRPNRDPPTR